MKRLLLSIGLAGICWAGPSVDFPPQIEIRVANPPMVAPMSNGDFLVYELLLCNHQLEPQELRKLTFLDQSGRTLLEWDSSQLAKAIGHFGVAKDTSTTLPPGGSMVVFCYLPKSEDTVRVSHDLEFASRGKIKTLRDEGFTIQTGEIPVLASPFGKAGHWNAASSASNESAHRRAIMTLNGHFHSAQRFAVDWVLTDDKHRYFRGDGRKLEDHYCYGVPALAVADGTVVDLQDGLAEGPPSDSARPYTITPRTLGGNWVALQVAPQRYAMYAHLQPGSLRVTKGEHVKQGEVLGLIGSSGNSDAPHLHLHMSDRPDWINAEGVPYAFSFFRMLGKSSSPDDGQHVQFTPYPKGEFRARLPIEDALIEFEENP